MTHMIVCSFSRGPLLRDPLEIPVLIPPAAFVISPDRQKYGESINKGRKGPVAGSGGRG